MPEDLFGKLRGPWNVENAVLATLREWLPAYLHEIEEQNGLPAKALGRCPTPESYHGGLDWQSEQQDTLPEVIVICKPFGEPRRLSTSSLQTYQVEVGCIVLATEDPIESNARMKAGLWATATMLLGQHGALGAFIATETVLVGSPNVEFLDDENRRLAVGITTWHVTAEILQPTAGPVTVKEVEPEGPYPNNPEVKTETFTITADP